MTTIGIYLQTDPPRLHATLASLARHAPHARVVLLPDAPDVALAAALGELRDYPQLASADLRGAPAAFNRLIAFDDAPLVVFLEGGVVVTDGWLERLRAALEEGPQVGLAGPSTNLAWNEQGLRDAPGFHAGLREIDAFAARLAAAHGGATATLEPLYSLADFCYAVRREVIAAIGGADEGYGVGPCWEMDYNIRAARAGFSGVWVAGAYAHRPPHTARRARDERAWFSASKRRYQDRFCGLRLRGEKADYEPHCRGAACEHFAPPALIQMTLPLVPDHRPPTTDHRPPTTNARTSVQSNVPATNDEESQDSIQNRAPLGESKIQNPESPVVSCIMPTYNRRAFVPQAIRCFLRQDYPNLELLILDDGTDPVADCVPQDPRIRYIRLDTRRSIGVKRNLACAEARGEFIVHWDDDDWYPSWRVRVQLEALRDRSADVCGSSQVYYFDPAADRAWHYRYSGQGATWVAGNTLAYRKSFWARNQFPDVQIGEDTRFVWADARKHVCDLTEPSLCVATLHQTNTSPKAAGGLYWHPLPPAHIHALLNDDLGFLRAERVSSVHAGAAHVETSTRPPLVSCIMPTYNRRAFVPLALRCFLDQDYPSKELVIVDDGSDPVSDLVENLPGVRYTRLPARLSIGMKRNLACEQARGEIIAHWDDDDWYAPDRLSYQVRPILAGSADITGLENAFVLQLPSGTFWTTCPQLHQRMFVGNVHGGTLIYHKALIEQGLRYPDVNLAEDALLLRQAVGRGKRLARLSNPGVFVYVRHGRNAWQFEPGRFLDPAGWEHIPPPATFPVDALAFYQAAAASNSGEHLHAERIVT